MIWVDANKQLPPVEKGNRRFLVNVCEKSDSWDEEDENTIMIASLSERAVAEGRVPWYQSFPATYIPIAGTVTHWSELPNSPNIEAEISDFNLDERDATPLLDTIRASISPDEVDGEIEYQHS